MDMLETKRQEIDQIDQALADLLIRRMEITGQIGVYKAEHGLPVLHTGREKEVLAQVMDRAPQDDEALRDALKTIFQTIMAASRQDQEKKIEYRRNG